MLKEMKKNVLVFVGLFAGCFAAHAEDQSVHVSCKVGNAIAARGPGYRTLQNTIIPSNTTAMIELNNGAWITTVRFQYGVELPAVALRNSGLPWVTSLSDEQILEAQRRSPSSIELQATGSFNSRGVEIRVKQDINYFNMGIGIIPHGNPISIAIPYDHFGSTFVVENVSVVCRGQM